MVCGGLRLVRIAPFAIALTVVLVGCEDDGAPPDAEQACLADPPSASYPAVEQGYGCATGDVIANFRFTLPVEAGDVSRTLGEYHDQAAMGAKLLVWLSATGWCGACRYTARDLDALYAARGAEGVYVMASLAENEDGDAATSADAVAWRDSLELDYEVVADNWCAAGTDSFGACGASIAELPTVFVIDLATMRILYRATTDRHVDDVITRALEAML